MMHLCSFARSCLMFASISCVVAVRKHAFLEDMIQRVSGCPLDTYSDDSCSYLSRPVSQDRVRRRDASSLPGSNPALPWVRQGATDVAHFWCPESTQTQGFLVSDRGFEVMYLFESVDSSCKWKLKSHFMGVKRWRNYLLLHAFLIQNQPVW